MTKAEEVIERKGGTVSLATSYNISETETPIPEEDFRLGERKVLLERNTNVLLELSMKVLKLLMPMDGI